LNLRYGVKKQNRWRFVGAAPEDQITKAINRHVG
jgi:hypothetical protein